MYGSKFQWLIVGMYDDDWWEKDDNSTECNPSEIKTALVGVMVMDIQALASREEITVSGRVRMSYSISYSYLVSLAVFELLDETKVKEMIAPHKSKLNIFFVF